MTLWTEILLVCLLSGGVSDELSLVSHTPPDSSMLATVLQRDPVDLLVFMARTGWIPQWMDPAEIAMDLIHSGSAGSLSAAWAAWTAGYALPAALNPELMEFGDGSVIPTLSDVCSNPVLLDASMRRILHLLSRGEDPSDLEEYVELIDGCWSVLPLQSRELCLEVLGRLGIDITGDLPADWVDTAGIQAAARYCFELGITMDFSVSSTDSPLCRIYASGCCNDERASAMLQDPLWAVRYTAVDRCDPSQLNEIIFDINPYVALNAAIRRAEGGYTDGRERLSELALMDGPVGNMATENLVSRDSLLLRQLILNESPGKRAAAQSAWLEDSMAVDSALGEIWIQDGYWLVPISWAWHLTDSADSTAALRVLERIEEEIDIYDDPVLIIEYMEILRTELMGSNEDTTQAQIADWSGYSLPFDSVVHSAPDSIILRTNQGDFVINLWNETAPLACRSFWYLAEEGFYDGIEFHRVIPGFVAQAGCPQGNGTGGPGYILPNERSIRGFQRGVIGMADAGLNTAGSQFFIMLDSHGRLDGRYTAFGEVVNPAHLDEITVGTVITGIDEVALTR